MLLHGMIYELMTRSLLPPCPAGVVGSRPYRPATKPLRSPPSRARSHAGLLDLPAHTYNARPHTSYPHFHRAVLVPPFFCAASPPCY
jgi:hypothetical protein